MGKQWQSRIFHPPQNDDGRNRDIFPIPRLELDFVLRKRVSRSVARRVQRRGHFSLGVNAAIDSLNSMYFGKEVHDPGTVADFGLLPTSQRNCLKDIVQKVKYLGKPPSCMSSSGALEALRAAACGYSEPQAGVGDVVPMVLEELSLPTQGVAGVDLAAALEEPLKSQVVGFEDWMIQDADAWGDISKHVDELKPYNDPSLNCGDKYLCFLKRLHLSNVLGLSQCVRGRVGSFCVAKKSKVVDGKIIRRQRLVLDCRQVNTMFREPPHTSLGSLAALCELEIPPDKNLFISGGDIKDCFYACTMPPGLEEFFGLMDDLTSREAAWVFGGCEGYYASLSRRTPVINVLPMGFAWSFYIVQQLHQQSVLRSLSIGVQDLVLDGQPAPSLAGPSGDPVVSMPYCDNVHTISCCKDRCSDGKENIVNDLKELGFEIHEEEGPSELFLTLGGEVDGVTGVVRPTRQRIWNVIYAFKHLVVNVVSRELVQRLLGHAMVICTINRCGMGIFRKLYDFVHSQSEPRLLNRSELKEVRMFIGLVPLLSGDMRKQWSSQVTATDASPEGFGIVVRDLDVTSVKQIGQWQERWRFKRLPVEEWCPRRRALGQNVFLDVSTAGFVSEVVQQSEQYISNNDFPEVPHNILQPDEWSTVCMGKWKHVDEAITIKEGRALVLALRRLARAQWSRGHKHLILLDNLALTFSVAKGRASNHTLLRINQKISALSLAGGFAVRVRWIPSELNNADGPSRGQIKPGPFAAGFGEEEGAKEVFEVSHSCGHKCEKHSEASPRLQSPQGRNGSSGGEESSPWAQESFAAAGEADQSFSEVSSNSWEAAEGGRGTRWQKSSAGNDDYTGEEKCFEGSGVAIHSIPGDVQEFLYGARSPLAPFGRRRHRQVHGRHDGLDVPSRQVEQRRRKGPCCRGVRFYRPPRSRRALRGWRKEMPPESRLPAPMLMVYGLAMALISMGEKEMGLKVLTDFDCYLRPGEGLSLLARNIIPPVAAAGLQYQTFCLVVKEFEQGVPDKVGIFDTSIPLDSKGRQWLGEMLFQLAKKRPKKDSPLFGFSADQFRKKFRLAAKKMGVGHLHPYQLRHGGASEDLNSRSRDYGGVKQRGRWSTDKSVRRYTKVGRVQQLLNQLSPEMLEYCRWSLRNMEGVMTGQMIPKMI